MGKKILVTGAAGFIGFHLCRALLRGQATVLGVDNLDPYYSVTLKNSRLAQLQAFSLFDWFCCDLNDPLFLEKAKAWAPDVIVHLAAQAGVRYSLVNPQAYTQSNLSGFTQVLELARHCQVAHLIYASSSSVYGLDSKAPFSINARADTPASFYAATKRANELMAHSYSYLFHIPTTGLRFFTVYGSWGRPDMAYYTFTDKILRGEVLQIFNHGHMKRDFTHVEDVIEAIARLLDLPPQEQEGRAPVALYNVGASAPVPILDFIECLGNLLEKKPLIRLSAEQKTDLALTYADVSALEARTGYRASVSLEQGLKEFVTWYRAYHVL